MKDMKTRVIDSNIELKERESLLADLGRAIRQAREARGMSQLALSLATGLSKTFLCDLENGRRNPSFETLCRLAKALTADVSELVMGAGEFALPITYFENASK